MDKEERGKKKTGEKMKKRGKIRRKKRKYKEG